MDVRWLIFIGAMLGMVYSFGWDETTPLDEYVHSDDGYYSWRKIAEYRYFNATTVHVINMTSQKYQDETFVDNPIWWHIMGVAIPDPDNLTYPDNAFMFIDGGSNDINDGPPDRDDTATNLVAIGSLDLKTIVAYIKAIPNQPLVFANDPTQRSRKEDSIIAWTWRTFIDNPDADPSVILRMPMTKAAKRGLDTINEVATTLGENPLITNVSKFMVAGASKRGWTTWSIAATDRRVIAAAPLVFSLLNFNDTLMAHFQAMGGAWSFAFESYYRENLTQELLTPRAQEAFQYEDMYYYRERLTLPIYQVVATGDEFFLNQDSFYWWNGIPDPKWTYMMENSEHSMFPHYVKMYDTAVGWYGSIMANEPIPRVSWTYGEMPDGVGYVQMVSDTDPETIDAFRAVTLFNDTRRDFRLAEGSSQEDFQFHPVRWEDYFNITIDNENRVYTTTAIPVEDEWTSIMIRLMFRGPNGNRMFMTSQTNIIPNTFNTEPCYSPETCYSIMV